MATPFNPTALNSADPSNGSMSLDQVNKAFRQSDVYKQWMQAHGKPIDGHVSLTKSEEAGLGKTLELNGFALPDGWHIDAGGNIAGDSHLARNILIGAGIAAAAFGLPAVMGALGGGAGAASSATAGGGAAVGDAGAATTLGLASGAGVPGAVAGVGSAAGAAGGVGAGVGTLSKVANLLGAVAPGIGKAATAAGENALDQEKLALDANQQNTYGQSSYESELMARAKEEAAQRSTALKDVFMSNLTTNAPHSPFNPAPPPTYTPQYKSTIQALADQGAGTLAKPAAYSTGSMSPLAPYQPIDITNVQGATNTKPGAISTIANWLAPGATLSKGILDLFK